MNNLANSYSDLGRQADALKLHQDTLALMRTELGPDHPDTLRSMHNVADQLTPPSVEPVDALDRLQETLALRTAKLGPGHPDTLQSMSSLAADLRCPRPAGRRQEARRRDSRTSEGQARPRPPRHTNDDGQPGRVATSPSVARPMVSSSETMILERRRAKFGLDHRNTLLTMDSLADRYVAFGRPPMRSSFAKRRCRYGRPLSAQTDATRWET